SGSLIAPPRTVSPSRGTASTSSSSPGTCAPTTTIGRSAEPDSDMRHRGTRQVGDEIVNRDVGRPFDGAVERRLRTEPAEDQPRRRGDVLADAPAQRLEQTVLGEREAAAEDHECGVEDEHGVRDPDGELVEDEVESRLRVGIA